MDCCNTQSSSCGCTSGCCGIEQGKKEESKKVVIDFLYLDLDVCTRCQGADQNLEDAIGDVVSVLKLTGVDVTVNKIHINSIEKVKEYKFISSPTIRVNGRDIQMEVKESLCECCGDLCGDEVDCRVWVYKGMEYDVPPKAMIIDGILREVYRDGTIVDHEKNDEPYQLPENLRRFFESMDKKELK